ncbi:presenilin-1 [Rhipicephalus microplus]|uniref:presenilin-1 n=1 Tax=Rhipicephalus microplus TaxID=6941 RepID=UPI003F6A8351
MDTRRVLGLLARLYEEILRQAITLVTAVSICMLSVSVLIRVLESSRNDDFRLGYVRYPEKDGESGRGDEDSVLLMSSFANAFSFLSVIMIVNCTLVLLYKSGHYRIIQAWLMGGSAILLFATGYYYGGRLLFYFNVSVDHVSWSFVTWNIGMTGIAALYFDGPYVVQQGYLIYTSVLMALTIGESLPEWTAWTLLVLISIWDVFAVLCVVGPLRMLIETAKERNEPLFPALIFSTSSAWCYGLGEHTASLIYVDAVSSAVSVRSDLCLHEAGKSGSVFASPVRVSALTIGRNDHDMSLGSSLSREAIHEREYSPIAFAITSDLPLESSDQDYLAPPAKIGAFASVSSEVRGGPARGGVPGPTAASSRTSSMPGKKEHAGGSSVARTFPRQDPRHFRAAFYTRDGRSLPVSRRGADFPDAQRDKTPPHFVPARNMCACNRPAAAIGNTGGYAHQTPPAADLPGSKGMKMGLGDFIFYSVLVGEASMRGSAVTVLVCYVSVIVGIFLTLGLLVMLQKPLPALPLSISMGLLAYFSSVSLIEPFLDTVGFMAL